MAATNVTIQTAQGLDGTASGVVMHPLPPEPENAAPIPMEDWTLFKQLPKFNFRDGDPSDASSLLLKATIPKPWHWVPIEGMPPARATEAVDGYIKSHIAYVGANRPSGMSDATVRKAGILLGTARAVSTSFYGLTDADITPGEKAEPLLSTYADAAGEMRFLKKPGLAAAQNTVLDAALSLNDEEKAVVCSLVTSSAGIIPMQGYSLIMNQHHYLSQADSQSRKIFAVVEKAFWKSSAVAGWFQAETQFIQDILWHKACHPVLMNIKETCAMNPNVKDMLVTSGAGACASRLPAEETELRTASSYITLMATVNPMFRTCKGSIDFGDLVYVSDLARSLPVNVANPVMPANIPAGLRTTITSRTTAVRYLGEMLKRNQDAVAYCFGWYNAMSDASMTMGGGGSTAADTLKTSWSLTKLRSQSYASYIGGFQAYGDYTAVRNKMRAEGVFQAPNFSIG